VSININIEETLAGVFEEVFDQPIQISRELTASDVEEWDSLTHIRLLLAVERRFSIRFTSAEAGGMAKLGDLMDVIQAKVAARS
jgi:acyl carrier protein